METRGRAPYASRYETLDGWRGLAALAVCFHHMGIPRENCGMWLGVQLFFVISGYCIAAAADRTRVAGASVGRFIQRRAKRILPPYWAHVAFTLGCWVYLAATTGEGGLKAVVKVLARPLWVYAQNATLLQWTTLTEAAIHGQSRIAPTYNASLLNQVDWSLCYEEQFYLFVALALALAPLVRPGIAFVALGLASAVFRVLAPSCVTGLLPDYWLQFAAGIVLHYRLCRVSDRRTARLLDAALGLAFGVVTLAAWSRGELHFDILRYEHFYGQLSVCLGFALVLLALRRFDARLADSAVGRAAGALGKISYSLYLIHYPVLCLLVGLRARLLEVANVYVSEAVGLAITLAVAWVFYRLFEKPFVPAPSSDRTRVAPIVVETPAETPTA